MSLAQGDHHDDVPVRPGARHGGRAPPAPARGCQPAALLDGVKCWAAVNVRLPLDGTSLGVQPSPGVSLAELAEVVVAPAPGLALLVHHDHVAGLGAAPDMPAQGH